MNKKQIFEGIDNKEIAIFVAIIITVVILLIFELFFFEGRKDVKEDMSKSQERLEEMQKETVVSEQKTVYKAVNDVVAMMNNKEYEKLYAMLKDDYKDYYFRDYSNFEKFIKEYASLEYYPKYNSYYRDGDLYYIIVNFLKTKYTREELLNIMPIKVDTLVFQEISEGNFNFTMNGFVESIEYNKSKTVDGITFKLASSIRNTETMKTTIVVSNDSDKTMSVNTDNIDLDIVGSKTARLSESASVTIQPGEVGMLEIEYYFQYNSNREFKGITVRGAKFADGTIIEDVYISK